MSVLRGRKMNKDRDLKFLNPKIIFKSSKNENSRIDIDQFKWIKDHIYLLFYAKQNYAL